MKWLWILTLFATADITISQETVIRQTSSGPIEGFTVDLVPANDSDTRRLDAFVGIPYAQPPVGNLRWKPPELPSPWEEALDTKRFGPCCPQILEYLDFSFGPDYNNTDEDCLYLNVYAPREADTEDPLPTYPVMVWIHGGANIYGCGEEYDGRILATRDVVVVTINYRLGKLGYLSTDDEVAPGNFALLDQVTALQWVKENIANFGGDPDQITLFGNSAGGSHTSLHLFSQLHTEGAFHAVISQSGSAFSPWAVYRPPNTVRDNTVYLAQLFDCPTSSSQVMVDCLMEIEADALAYADVPSFTPSNGAFAPNVDGTFLTDTPENLIARGDYLTLPFLSGTVPDESADGYFGADEGYSREEKEALMYSRSRRYGDAADAVYDAFLHEYDLPGEDFQEQRDLYLELRTDNEYIAPHDQHALLHSQEVARTYLYSFEHRADSHPYPEWMGVPHFEECYYIFGVPFWDEAADCPWGCRNNQWFPRFSWNEEDELVARNMMTIWTNFARQQEPVLEGFEWPAFNTSTQSLAVIRPTLTTGQYYKYRRSSFNNIYLPKMLNTTYC